ncbi:MAG TPA: hypothetical protein VHW47_02570 [Acidimicrobiales bacterium]|nr:hypothetical protein [Acidimicrobiales bacterium]
MYIIGVADSARARIANVEPSPSQHRGRPVKIAVPELQDAPTIARGLTIRTETGAKAVVVVRVNVI